jgi:hypothetical protein
LTSGFLSAKYLLRKVLTKERTTGPRIIAINPLTAKPGTKTAASQKQIPFTTNENRPKLKKLSGRDSIDKVGRTNELTKPTAMAAITAMGNVSISTPGTVRSTTKRLKAVARVVRRKLSIFSSLVE